MDPIKESFQRVKEDMDYFYDELYTLRQDLNETRGFMLEIRQILEEINEKLGKKPLSTDRQTNTTNQTHYSTHNTLLEPLKAQIYPFSKGNEGVPTDRQTNQQTDNFTQNLPQKHSEITDFTPIPEKTTQLPLPGTPIDDAARILDSLDSLKKEIRLKFKKLTEQEIAVFSTLYQLDEEIGPTDYRTIASKLGLTESSIRDYIGRLIKKVFPSIRLR